MSDTRQRISVAIAAMGGQGGGVLADWLVEIAESNGYYAQATSVPGVAQRTGATIYYIELHPEVTSGQQPVLALMPVPGDVDVVVAAELAEAGRAVQRGIVTPDRTTLIASTHRAYALVEKSAMADGRRSSGQTLAAIGETAKRLIAFDMQALADKHNTVISASLFGALAGSACLPFSRSQFEQAISSSGKAVEANLAAFGAAFVSAASESPQAAASSESSVSESHFEAANALRPLLERCDDALGDADSAITHAAIERLVDYQDNAYAELYLERLIGLRDSLQANGGGNLGTDILNACARHLALWMSYEDTIRVADLKIRAERFKRVRGETDARDDEIVNITEFMHPRIEEVADTLPHKAGAWLLRTSWLQQLLRRTVLRERKIDTSKLRGFLLLYFIAGLRARRRGSYRFQVEQARIEAWLARINGLIANHRDVALEVVKCQQLIKGYGDTHARGWSNFEKIMGALDQHGATVTTAKVICELRDAALADEKGDTLEQSLAAVA